MTDLEIRDLNPALGAEVSGFDPRAPLEDAVRRTLQDALDRRVEWSVQLEVDVPFFGPGREQQDRLALALHQHRLEPDHGHVSVVLVGRPIEVRTPKPRESKLGERKLIQLTPKEVKGGELQVVGRELASTSLKF